MLRSKLDKIPCASLLIRILEAPKSSDGMIILSRDYFPSSEWERHGVFVPAPTYEKGKYNSELCVPSNIERELFFSQQKRQALSTRNLALKIIEKEVGKFEMVVFFYY